MSGLRNPQRRWWYLGGCAPCLACDPAPTDGSPCLRNGINIYWKYRLSNGMVSAHDGEEIYALALVAGCGFPYTAFEWRIYGQNTALPPDQPYVGYIDATTEDGCLWVTQDSYIQRRAFSNALPGEGGTTDGWGVGFGGNNYYAEQLIEKTTPGRYWSIVGLDSVECYGATGTGLDGLLRRVPFSCYEIAGDYYWEDPNGNGYIADVVVEAVS